MSKVPVCFIPKIETTSSGTTIVVYNNLSGRSFTSSEAEWVRFQLSKGYLSKEDFSERYAVPLPLTESLRPILCLVDEVGLTAIQTEFSKPLTQSGPEADIERLASCMEQHYRRTWNERKV